MHKRALFVGNSSGIGLAVTRQLLKRNWRVTGISRSDSPIEHQAYDHVRARVEDPEFEDALDSILETTPPVDLCVYCAGIGELLDLAHMSQEIEIFDVNLMGMIRTVSRVIPAMIRRGSGHVIGLSSLADEMLSPQAPSYHASKAGFSNYLEGLALAARPQGVFVTNVRFGFVDTKMAKGDVRPCMISTDRAARHLLRCIEKKPMRYSAPWSMIPLVKLRRWMLTLKVLLG